MLEVVYWPNQHGEPKHDKQAPKTERERKLRRPKRNSRQDQKGHEEAYSSAKQASTKAQQSLPPREREPGLLLVRALARAQGYVVAGDGVVEARERV